MALSTVDYKNVGTDNNGIWYELNGTDYGTDVKFHNSEFCVTPGNKILDGDGFVITDGDYETIAVRNTLGL